MGHPLTVTLGQGSERDLHLVARADEAEFLKAHRYRSEAIGLPFVYALEVPAETPDRIPGSVLIIPSHSSRLKHISNASTFASLQNYVLNFRTRRRRTVVSLHDEDLGAQTGNSVWMHSGLGLVEGAAVDDASALFRMRYLFSLFETVLTDHVGSAVPMALACGAQVCIHLPEIDARFRSLADEKHEEAREDPHANRDWIIGAKPELITGLESAVQDQAWGLSQLGYGNIQPPETLKKILGWDSGFRRLRRTSRLMHKMRTLGKMREAK